MTQLWRPPAAWVPPPPGSPPVARAEAQNRTELNGPEGLTARGQVKGSLPGGKGLVHRRSRRCRKGLAGAGSCMPGSPREPQAVTYGDSRAGGHLPLSTPLDHGTLVFKSKERSPLPTGHTSACEASPAGSSQPPGPSLHPAIRLLLQLPQASHCPALRERRAQVPAVTSSERLHVGLSLPISHAQTLEPGSGNSARAGF